MSPDASMYDYSLQFKYFMKLQIPSLFGNATVVDISLLPVGRFVIVRQQLLPIISHQLPPHCGPDYYKMEEFERVFLTFSSDPINPRRGHLTRSKFEECLRFLQLCHDRVLIARIFGVMDKNRSQTVDLTEFAGGLQTFLRGSQEDRKDFLFRIFDQDGGGSIEPPEFMYWIKAVFSLGKDAASEETCRLRVQHLVRDLTQQEHADEITREQFFQNFDKSPLMLRLWDYVFRNALLANAPASLASLSSSPSSSSSPSNRSPSSSSYASLSSSRSMSPTKLSPKLHR